MKVIITSKNVNASDHLKKTIEKKLAKLEKYFSDDIGVHVMLTEEKNKKKMEVTIKAKGTIFRGEARAEQFYDAIDLVAEKLSSQMTRFKGKLQKKHKDAKDFRFEFWPEAEQETEDIRVTRTKKFELEPMSVEEAVLQMEMLEHTFYIFLNRETDSVNAVYKRKENDYGLLETTY